MFHEIKMLKRMLNVKLYSEFRISDSNTDPQELKKRIEMWDMKR